MTRSLTTGQVAIDAPNAPESTRQLGSTLLDVNRRHERLIDGLLVLASSDQQRTEHSPVDLAEIARRVATQSQDAARQARTEIRTHFASGPVLGDSVLLERLAQNLLDNAIRYNLAEHGWVSMTTGTIDGHAHITVANTGPAVPADEVDGLFEPFRRLTTTDRLTESDSALPGRGAGLGLSIVRSVAHAHHGDVHARPRPDGGLAIRVQIPTAAPATDDHSE